MGGQRNLGESLGRYDRRDEIRESRVGKLAADETLLLSSVLEFDIVAPYLSKRDRHSSKDYAYLARNCDRRRTITRVREDTGCG